MLQKPIKKKKQKERSPPQGSAPKRSHLAPSKLLNREMSHVILTEPKPRHKRQSSCAPTNNNQSTSQKISIGIQPSNRKLLESSSKKINTKSKKNVKSPRIKKFQSYLLYIDTQFSLFSDQTKSKLSDYSTDVKRDIEMVEEKDDMIELIKKYKRDYVISQSKLSQYEKQQLSKEDRAAENIKNKWKLYRTRKLIGKFVRINKIKQRPENIPSNINKIQKDENEKEMKSMLSVQTIKSEFQSTHPNNILVNQEKKQKVEAKSKAAIITISHAPCIETIKIKQIERIMLKQKESITRKHSLEIQELQRRYKSKIISRQQYQKGVRNANTFVGIRYAEINQSILNVRKLVSHTDGFLHELQSHGVMNNTALRCESQSSLPIILSQSIKQFEKPKIDPSRPHNQFDYRYQEPKVELTEQQKQKNQKMVDEILGEIIFQFCKDTQRYPYIQKIMIECFADWKIGVECNQDAIDLFCQNIIQYVLSSNPHPFQTLNVPLGCPPQQLLKLHHTHDFQPDKEEDVIPDHIFKDFSKLMVFPLKSKNSPKQLSIIKLIEILNHYHNRAIFQSLNQALDYQRVYGIVGKTLPWKSEPNFKKCHVYQSLSSAVDKVMGYQEWRLGFHPENFFSIRPDLTIRNLNMFRDDKLNRLMENEQKELETYWQNDQMQETFLLLDLSNELYNHLIKEVTRELQLMNKVFEKR